MAIREDRLLSTLRWIAGSMCALVLWVSLVFWPRSYFRSDDVRDPDPDTVAPVWVMSDPRPISLYGALTTKDLARPDSEFNKLRWISKPLTAKERATEAVKRLTVTKVANGTQITIPYWWVVAASGVGLILCAASPKALTRRRKSSGFRIFDLIALTTLLAIWSAFAPSVYGRLGEGGAVVMGEILLLFAAAYAVARYARRLRGEQLLLASIGALFLAFNGAGLGYFCYVCMDHYRPVN